LFCVIDGNGGDECAVYLEKNLPIAIREVFQDEIDKSFNIFESVSNKMRTAFHQLDQEFHQTFRKTSLTCGATACVVLILGEIVFCVNLGDCRAVVSRKTNMVELSQDHAPTRPEERDRIESQGGYVQADKVFVI
jgi:protein phosphatase 2C family protein 2/3